MNRNLYPETQYHSAFYRYLFIIALFMAPAFVSAQNLITNSDFSNGTTGWSSSCSMEVYAETVYGGSNSSNYVTEIDEERCLDQTICVFPGVTYNLSFRATRRIDSQTPNTVGITVTVTGATSGTSYVSQNKTYNNTTFNFTTTTYSFTVPGNSTDRKVTLHIRDYNSHSTYGVILDNIELHPATDMTLSGSISAAISLPYAYSVSNAPASGVSYNWSFGSNATPTSSITATPSVNWSTTGNKPVTVALSNGTCVVATLSTNVAVTSVLPVHFVNYTGSLKENKAVITWSTADEQNNDHFIIERSTNGSTYDSVGRVQASTMVGTNNYSYTETNYNATTYYRIRQVDVNGSYTYSGVIILKNNSSSKEMTVYPSVASTTIQYAIGSDAQANAMVQVFDFSGRAMINSREVLNQGANLKALDVSHLATGAYILKVSVPSTGLIAVKQFQKR